MVSLPDEPTPLADICVSGSELSTSCKLLTLSLLEPKDKADVNPPDTAGAEGVTAAPLVIA